MIKQSVFIGLTALAFTATSVGAITNDQLNKKINSQNKKIKQLQQQINATASAVDSQSKVSWADKTTIGGYGELHFNAKQYNSDNQVDAHRFVIFLSHDYSEKVKFFSELELEHSLAGDGKPGEVELEQAYIQWQFSKNHRLTSGLFLIPVGILNETHEPNTFYGTERNSLEKRIIPATWWETGVMFSGNLAKGLSYDIALHSGLNATSESETMTVESSEIKTTKSVKYADIRSGRQKSAKADANNSAYTARIKYTAIPGLELAASVQVQEDITQGTDGLTPTSANLYTAHAVYQTGKFALRSVYAAWDVAGDVYDATSKVNLSGWYIEPAYKLTEQLGLFVRHTQIDDETKEDDYVKEVSYGVNYWLDPQVVFKLDVADDQTDDDKDSINLGMGWSF
jgi:hypothetical protein